MSKNKVLMGLSIKDRSKDMTLMRMSKKYSLGELIGYRPLCDNKFNFIEILNFEGWKKSFNYTFDTNVTAKYLLNKSVKNIFSITEKQIVES